MTNLKFQLQAVQKLYFIMYIFNANWNTKLLRTFLKFVKIVQTLKIVSTNPSVNQMSSDATISLGNTTDFAVNWQLDEVRCFVKVLTWLSYLPKTACRLTYCISFSAKIWSSFWIAQRIVEKQKTQITIFEY